MKKCFMTVMALMLGIGMLNARPIDVNKAMMVGQKFVQANFDLGLQDADLELVYTGASTRGEACFYVFNLGDHGYVMVSADDAFRPIVGYSKERAFDAQNINPELAYMLNRLIESRTSRAIGEPSPMVASEWQSVIDHGKQHSFNGGREGFYLVQTKWDQGYPYNYYCPAGTGGPGGHMWAGCVATAMSQIMKFWNHPAQGTGSHTNPYGGSANFGNTTYDWDNMPLSLSGSSPQEQIDAVATLMYQCAVSVDMQWDVDGSGAHSTDVPSRIVQYFGYSNAAVFDNRDYYTREAWNEKLKESIDLGWPLYYSGHDPTPVTGGGHAFVCDGYDDANMFHYNWGWSGSGDDFFDFDDIDYNTSDGAIFNFVPAAVYNSTPQAPTNFTVTRTSDVAQEATLTWVNPSKTLTNVNINSLDRVVVERDGRVIYTEENVTPGATMTFVDSEVPCYTRFNYRVYTYSNGVKGKNTTASEIFGPTCQWKFFGTCTNMTGWKGAKLVALDGAGREITSFTMTSSNPAAEPIDIPIGPVTLIWVSGTDNVSLSFWVKDAEGNMIYEQPQVNSNTIEEGVVYSGQNRCGNSAPSEVPGELFVSDDNGVVKLEWPASAKATYGYNVYRDGLLCYLAHETEFIDTYAPLGGHCYQVCVLGDGGESEFSNEVCGTSGEGCAAGYNLGLEIQENGKPIISWEMPDTEELGGFVVYRKVGEDGEYRRIKLLSPSKRQYKETSSMEDEQWHYYRVTATYKDIDCESAPFKAQYGNEFFVKAYYSLNAVEDVNDQQVSLYPNPTKGSFTVSAENLQQVMVYNTVGQLVLNQQCEGNSAVLNLNNVESGIYMVKVFTATSESIQKLSVIK